ncbi:MAG: hypothetical protein A2V86_09205 [Deltaproteobacteria bacterium RBG_16_49_23]|nr:MAG: hypothetical protein A2V86_09205 [Deltaproteobacteria bacterium RBG_16_49_23]
MILENFLPGVRHLQNIHPLVIHFPIAFWVGAALFYGLALGLRSDPMARTAFSLLILGTISAVVAVATGLYGGEGVMIARSVREHLLEPHKKVMISTLGISIILAAWAAVSRPFPNKGRAVFLFILLLLLGIMMVGADYGARMVYDYNAGGNACSQPIEFTR